MKFAYFNQQGRAETAHNDDTIIILPAGAVELTDAQFLNRFDYELVDNTLMLNPIVPPAPTLNALKLAKKAEITQAFNLNMSAVVGDTPNHEISSWGKQEAEARAFANAATTNNPTPLIDNLATARGIPKALLAGKIIQKADLYSSYSGQLIGKRQGLEDAIDAATTKAAVAAISW